MSKKSYKRELVEWTILVTIALTLYFTGLHTEVIGQIQRIVLATGVISPDTEKSNDLDASYDFKLENIGGDVTDFSEFKGKTIFLNFWATWCPPCIAEMPDIHDLYEKTGKDVVFVMVSLDQDQHKARRFVERKAYEFPVYFPISGMPSVYGGNSIPRTFVISPAGKIVFTRQGMAKYDTGEFREFLLSLD